MAQAMYAGMKSVREFRYDTQDAFTFNWRLAIDREFQTPFPPTHENMAALDLSLEQPVHLLAANLRRAFSGIVAGNVKAPGVAAVRAHGPYQLHGEPALMAEMDALLTAFVQQGRMKIDGNYTPCYEISR
ncbi:MAG: pyrimidine/purine nucleotide monophosphate nucleosidase domain-containing protein [Litorivicinus sp.]